MKATNAGASQGRCFLKVPENIARSLSVISNFGCNCRFWPAPLRRSTYTSVEGARFAALRLGSKSSISP